MADNYKYSLLVLCYVQYLEKLIGCFGMLMWGLKSQYKLCRILHTFLWELSHFPEKGKPQF